MIAAIEFLKGGKFLAATEPTRRGGGSAMVVRRGDLVPSRADRQQGAGVVDDGVRVRQLLDC